MKKVVWYRGGGMCASVEFSWIPTKEEIEEAGNEAYREFLEMKEKQPVKN